MNILSFIKEKAFRKYKTINALILKVHKNDFILHLKQFNMIRAFEVNNTTLSFKLDNIYLIYFSLKGCRP
jgi:hypothetical protein